MQLIVFAVCVWFVHAKPSVGHEEHPRAAPDGSTFRVDYGYHEQAGGWLKLHPVPTPWHVARLMCHLEGAQLASPLTGGLYAALRTLMREGRRESLFTGIHTMYSEDDYYSVEGVHISQIPLEWAEGDPNNYGNSERCIALGAGGLAADWSCQGLHAYACYQRKRGVMSMNECGNYDKQYVKDRRTGSCYKHYALETTWYRANTVCTADGGHLAIINSEEEAEILKKLALGKQQSEFMFVGFFNWFPEDGLDRGHWATLDGKSLEEAGFAGWRDTEPNNAGGQEYCGSLLVKQPKAWLNDLPCNWTVPFICEIEAPRVPV